jgi:hypothetical protein
MQMGSVEALPSRFRRVVVSVERGVLLSVGPCDQDLDVLAPFAAHDESLCTLSWLPPTLALTLPSSSSERRWLSTAGAEFMRSNVRATQASSGVNGWAALRWSTNLAYGRDPGRE